MCCLVTLRAQVLIKYGANQRVRTSKAKKNKEDRIVLENSWPVHINKDALLPQAIGDADINLN